MTEEITYPRHAASTIAVMGDGKIVVMTTTYNEKEDGIYSTIIVQEAMLVKLGIDETTTVWKGRPMELIGTITKMDTQNDFYPKKDT